MMSIYVYIQGYGRYLRSARTNMFKRIRENKVIKENNIMTMDSVLFRSIEIPVLFSFDRLRLKTVCIFSREYQGKFRMNRQRLVRLAFVTFVSK